MPRPRKTAAPSVPSNLVALAESVGEAIGRGVARALNSGLQLPQGGGNAAPARRRGRPPKSATAAVSTGGRKCSVQGCTNAVRSKGMCSAHYQAARRRVMQSGQQA
jgi:hypothetical protein